MMGLFDPAILDNDADWSGQNEDRSGSGQGVVGARSGVGDEVRSQTAQGEGGEPVGVNGNAYIYEKTGSPSLARVVKDSSCANG